MSVPIIDGIDYNTFQYQTVYKGESHFRGNFQLNKNTNVVGERLKALCNISQLIYGMPQVTGLNPARDTNMYMVTNAPAIYFLDTIL